MNGNSLAVVTGASTGIGLELARLAAADGYDLIVAANEARIHDSARELVRSDIDVQAVEADLGTADGVQKLVEAIGSRPIELLMANAGRGLGDAFLEQDFARAKDVVDLNITGTISLIHTVGRQMREQGRGRILITGSIAGFIPGAFQAVYNGTKAFLDSFSWALRNELQDSEVTVTCLMPGPVDTEFFDRADMQDTPVGKDDDKADPAKVAKDGYDAMMKGEAGIVSGFMNKIQVAFAGIIPDSILAQMHRKMARPDTNG